MLKIRFLHVGTAAEDDELFAGFGSFLSFSEGFFVGELGNGAAIYEYGIGVVEVGFCVARGDEAGSDFTTIEPIHFAAESFDMEFHAGIIAFFITYERFAYSKKTPIYIWVF